MISFVIGGICIQSVVVAQTLYGRWNVQYVINILYDSLQLVVKRYITKVYI